MPSAFYIVKLPLALGNIFSLTESIMAQSHDDAKNPYWGLIMDFWHCLKVMTVIYTYPSTCFYISPVPGFIPLYLM